MKTNMELCLYRNFKDAGFVACPKRKLTSNETFSLRFNNNSYKFKFLA